MVPTTAARVCALALLVTLLQTSAATKVIGVTEGFEMPDGKQVVISSLGVVPDGEDEQRISDGMLRNVWREIQTLLPDADEADRRRRGLNALGKDWGGWPNGFFPMRYNPANQPAKASRSQAQNAMDTWSNSGIDLDCPLGSNTNVNCPSLLGQCGGDLDGENSIVWLPTGFANNNNPNDDFVIGTAVYAIFGNDFECDIRMRTDLPSSLEWGSGSSLAFNEIDIESVLLHEMGHCLGLSHDDKSSSVMQASITTGSTAKRVLGPRDISFAQQVYGASNSVETTTTTKQTTTTTTTKKTTTTTTTKGGGVTVKTTTTTTKPTTTTVAGPTTLDENGCPAKAKKSDCNKLSCPNGLVSTFNKKGSGQYKGCKKFCSCEEPCPQKTSKKNCNANNFFCPSGQVPSFSKKLNGCKNVCTCKSSGASAGDECPPQLKKKQCKKQQCDAGQEPVFYKKKDGCKKVCICEESNASSNECPAKTKKRKCKKQACPAGQEPVYYKKKNGCKKVCLCEESNINSDTCPPKTKKRKCKKQTCGAGLEPVFYKKKDGCKKVCLCEESNINSNTCPPKTKKRKCKKQTCGAGLEPVFYRKKDGCKKVCICE